MDVILKVAKNSITPTVYNDMWQLDLEWMHGDADGSSHKKLMFSPEDLQKLKYFLAMYDQFTETDYLDEQARAWLKEHTDLNDDDVEDLAGEFGEDFYEGDQTTDYSNGAAWAGAILTYWDSDGQQFNVEWSVKKPKIKN